MANTHGMTTPVLEQQAYWGDALHSFVSDGGIPTITGALTLSVAACQAYTLRRADPERLEYLREPSARTITLSGGNGTYYLIAHASSSGAVPDWTRVPGTHYLWQVSATVPTVPTRSCMLAHVTVAAGTITQVLDARHRRITGISLETVTLTTTRSARWVVQPGATIQPASGVTLSLGPETLQAGDEPIFDLSEGGAVTFPEGALVRAAWWGAAPGVDSSAAIQAAWDAGPMSMHVTLGAGIFLIGTTVQSPLGSNADFVLEGQGAYQTILQRTPGNTGAILHIGGNPTFVRNFRLRDFGIEGIDRASGTYGIHMERANFFVMTNIRFFRCERALHVSGGTDKVFEQLWFEDNDYHLTFDNYDSANSTVTTIRDSWFRQSVIASLTIDGSVGALGLVREFFIVYCIFENGASTGTADTHVVITDAREIHFRNTHFEDPIQHVQITGNGTSNRHIMDVTFENCHMGQLRDPVGHPLAFQFTGVGSNDGGGCMMRGGLVSTEGTFNFTQTIPFEFKNVSQLSDQDFTGTQWRINTANKRTQDFQELPPALLATRTREVYKKDAVSGSRMMETFSSNETTNATPTKFGAVATNADTAARVLYEVLALSGTEWASWGIVVLIATALTGTPPDEVRQATIVGQAAVHTAIKSAGAATWDAVLSVTGGPVGVLCTGEAGVTIQWVVRAQILQTGVPILDDPDEE